MKRAFQARTASAQYPEGCADVVRQTADLALAERPYLTLDQAAVFLGFQGTDPRDACRRYLHRYAVPIVRVGRRILVRRDVLRVHVEGV